MVPVCWLVRAGKRVALVIIERQKRASVKKK